VLKVADIGIAGTKADMVANVLSEGLQYLSNSKLLEYLGITGAASLSSLVILRLAAPKLLDLLNQVASGKIQNLIDGPDLASNRPTRTEPIWFPDYPAYIPWSVFSPDQQIVCVRTCSCVVNARRTD
jgi:hypothetical protein